MSLAAHIIAAARDCLDTPFVHQGRRMGVGLDCVGLVVLVAAALGLPCRDQQAYSRYPHRRRLEAALNDQPALKPAHQYARGDVVLIRLRHEPQHVGIYTGSTLIHAYEPVGCVCEHDWPDGVLHPVRAYRFVEAP